MTFGKWTFGKWFGLGLMGLCCALGCCVTAQAQFNVYMGYMASDYTGIQCLSTTSAPCSSHGGTVAPSGLLVGGYYDFKTIGPVRLGVDLRYNHGRSNKSASDTGGGEDATGANTVLGGLRGSVKIPVKWLLPYAQVSFGRTSSNLTEPFSATVSSSSSLTPTRQYDSFFQYEVFAGADVKVFPIVDLRPIELGIGNMNRIGTGSGSTSVGVKSIGAALVFHLPR